MVGVEGIHEDGVAVPVASVDDLLCMKLSAIGGRGARRDFWDLHALLHSSGRSLDEALERFVQKYPNVDRGHVVRALCYFADAEAEPMPVGLTEAAWRGIRSDLERWAAALGA